MVPPFTKRANKAERAIQTFKRHFIAVLAGTHPSFPIDRWSELLPQAKLTLNMMRSYADQPVISAYHGIYRAPYDFLAHLIAPCGTLVVVVHDPQRAKWDPYGQVGFYLGPSLNHYQSYRCLISSTNSIRLSDSIILYPAPLVVPDTSRLDQLLSLTQQLTTCALYPTLDSDLKTKATLDACLIRLHDFLHEPNRPSPQPCPHASIHAITVPHVPRSTPTKDRSSSDTGIDLVGWSFPDRSFGTCTIVASDTFVDEHGTLWNTLEYSTQIGRKPNSRISKVSEVRSWTKRKGSKPPPRQLPPPILINQPVHSSLQQPTDPLFPFRSIVNAPLTTPPLSMSQYNLRTRTAMSAAIRFPHASPPPRPGTAIPLNLDAHGQPLTYKNSKAGPDGPQWTKAEAEEIIRLIDSLTLFALHYNEIPFDRRCDVVYYNPVGKQKLKDGQIQFRVRGTAGGNLLTVPYDVSARTADLDVVKLRIHSVISSDQQWMTIDIKDYYLGTSLPSSRYEYIRIPVRMIPPEVLERYNLQHHISNGKQRLLRDAQMYVRSSPSWQTLPSAAHRSPGTARLHTMP